MKNLSALLKQAQDMQAKMAAFKDGLEVIEIEGVAGGGLVRVTLNGKGAMVRLALDPSLMSKDEKEILEDLVVAAHNAARAKLDQRVQDEMAKMAGDLGLPPGLNLPF